MLLLLDEDTTISDISKNFKENLKMKMKKIPGFKRRRPKDERRLLDEALDDKCQRRKYWKCEKVGEKFHYL